MHTALLVSADSDDGARRTLVDLGTSPLSEACLDRGVAAKHGHPGGECLCVQQGGFAVAEISAGKWPTTSNVHLQECQTGLA